MALDTSLESSAILPANVSSVHSREEGVPAGPLRIPGRDIELRAGDTIVQAGNLHTWINRGDEPCRLLFVVVAGERGEPPTG